VKLAAEQLKTYRSLIAEEASHAYRSGDKNAVSWCDGNLWKEYSANSAIGRQIYASFTDKELLELLREIARRLGCKPTQKEVYCVYRSYLRKRFGNWPKALQRAGLSK
jgi:hypothetical protein